MANSASNDTQSITNTNNAAIDAQNTDNAAIDAQNINNAAINTVNTSNAATDGKKIWIMPQQVRLVLYMYLCLCVMVEKPKIQERLKLHKMYTCFCRTFSR